MKKLSDKEVSDEIIKRINKLNPESKPEWGKMNSGQMLAHCSIPFLISAGNLTVKRSFAGILIGGFIKKKVLSEEPFRKNLPTGKEFIIKDNKEFETEKRNLITLIEIFRTQFPDVITVNTHPFFGEMTNDDWSILSWKHTDHHLRQFGV